LIRKFYRENLLKIFYYIYALNLFQMKRNFSFRLDNPTGVGRKRPKLLDFLLNSTPFGSSPEPNQKLANKKGDTNQVVCRFDQIEAARLKPNLPQRPTTALLKFRSVEILNTTKWSMGNGD
jgi:hypothetical protein